MGEGESVVALTVPAFRIRRQPPGLGYARAGLPLKSLPTDSPQAQGDAHGIHDILPPPVGGAARTFPPPLRPIAARPLPRRRQRPDPPLESRYRKERLLGAGGQGVVYLGERQGADGFTLPVALKVFSPEPYRDAAAYEEDMGRVAAWRPAWP